MSKERGKNTGPKSEVGQKRKELYANTWAKIKSSLEAGYYLEAITLCESIICDRLEARIGWLSAKKSAQFNTIGKNIEILGYLDADERIQETYKKILKWASGRNEALHQMAKVPSKDSTNWAQKYEFARDVAEEGVRIAKELSNHLKRVNKE